MPVVGTELGNIYKSREGFGRAAIIPTVDAGGQYIQAQALKLKKEALAQKNKPTKPDKASLLKDIRAGKPEYWIQHNQELGQKFEELIDYGADILSAGVDPTKGYDKASADWQKRWAELENDSKLSLQRQAEYDAGKKLIDAKDADYTAESLQEWDDFYSKPLSWHKDKQQIPPRLISNKAPLEYMKGLQGMAKNLKTSNPEFEDSDIRTTAAAALADPSFGDKTLDAMTIQYNKMPKERQDALKTMAGLMGMVDETGNPSPYQYMVYKDLESQLGREPVDLNAMIDEFMPGLTHYGKTREEDDKTTATAGYYLKDKDAEEAAKAILRAEPRVLERMISTGEVLLSEEESKDLSPKEINDKQFEKATKAIQNRMLLKADKKHTSSITYDEKGKIAGYGRKTYTQDRDLFDQFIRGTIDFLPGYGELTAEEKEIARLATGEFMHGSSLLGPKGKAGRIVDFATPDELGDKAPGKTGGGKTLYKNPNYDPEDPESKQYSEDPESIKDGFVAIQDYDNYEIILDFGEEEEETDETDEYGEPISKKKRRVGRRVYDLRNPKSEFYLGKSVTEQIYNESLKARGELFIPQLIERFEAAAALKAQKAAKEERSRRFRQGGGTEEPEAELD